MKLKSNMIWFSILFCFNFITCIRMIDFNSPPYIPPSRPDNLYITEGNDTSCDYQIKDPVKLGSSKGFSSLQLGDTWNYYCYSYSSDGNDVYPGACTVSVKLVDTTNGKYKFFAKILNRTKDTLSEFVDSNNLLPQNMFKYLPVFSTDTAAIQPQILMDDSSYSFRFVEIKNVSNDKESIFKSGIGLIYKSESEFWNMGGGGYYLILLRKNNNDFNYCRFIHEFEAKENYLSNPINALSQ